VKITTPPAVRAATIRRRAIISALAADELGPPLPHVGAGSRLPLAGDRGRLSISQRLLAAGVGEPVELSLVGQPVVRALVFAVLPARVASHRPIIRSRPRNIAPNPMVRPPPAA